MVFERKELVAIIPQNVRYAIDAHKLMYLVNSPLQGHLQISLRSNGDTPEIYEHSQELSTGHSKFAANTS